MADETLFPVGESKPRTALPALTPRVNLPVRNQVEYLMSDLDSMIALDQPFEQRLIDETRIFISTSTPKGITKRWTMKLNGQLKSKPYDRKFEFGMAVAGRAKVRQLSFYV
jgi:hypothetical protein